MSQVKRIWFEEGLKMRARILQESFPLAGRRQWDWRSRPSVHRRVISTDDKFRNYPKIGAGSYWLIWEGPGQRQENKFRSCGRGEERLNLLQLKTRAMGPGDQSRDGLSPQSCRAEWFLFIDVIIVIESRPLLVKGSSYVESHVHSDQWEELLSHSLFSFLWCVEP